MDRGRIVDELERLPGGMPGLCPASADDAREAFALPPQRRTRSGGRRHWVLIFGLLAALTAMMAAITVFAFDSARQRKEAEIWYVHTLDVLLATSELKTSVNAALRGERGYLLTHDDRSSKSISNRAARAGRGSPSSKGSPSIIRGSSRILRRWRRG